MWRVRRVNYKKGSSSTTVQSYQPTEQEIRLQKQAADYSEAVAPNALWLNNVARDLLQDSLGTIQVDYNKLAQDATKQTIAAQQGVAGLTQGQLPAAYQQNMENSIKSGVQNTVGSTVADLAGRGVLSSSVANNALANINTAAANTMAEQYQNNIGTLNGLYGQQASLAGNNISLNAAAQEAAQQPALNLWNASLGLNSGGTLGALNAVSGQGTTTSTQSTSGGGGLFSGLFNGAVGAGISAWSPSCFTDDAKIKTPDGDKYIRHIHKGDKVYCYNDNGIDTAETVQDTLKPRYATTYAVVCADDKGKKKVVFTTLSQPLLTEDGEMVEVSVMRIGTKLKNVGRVLGIAESGERKVYDLKLTGSNMYYANGFIAMGGTNEW